MFLKVVSPLLVTGLFECVLSSTFLFPPPAAAASAVIVITKHLLEARHWAGPFFSPSFLLLCHHFFSSLFFHSSIHVSTSNYLWNIYYNVRVIFWQYHRVSKGKRIPDLLVSMGGQMGPIKQGIGVIKM